MSKTEGKVDVLDHWLFGVIWLHGEHNLNRPTITKTLSLFGQIYGEERR